MDNNLSINHDIKHIVDAVNIASEELQQAEKLIKSAEKRLKAHINIRSLNDQNFSQITSYNFKDMSKKKILRDTWRFILKKTQVFEVTSSKKSKELQAQIEHNEMPELTTTNIEATLQGIYANMGNYVNEAIQEVFDRLTGGASRWSKLKTHEKNKYQLKDKIIIEHLIDSSYGYDVYYNNEGFLNALGNAFSLLDGKGVQHYPDNLYSEIRQFCRTKEGNYETEYFKLKLFKNGNAHIKFKRLDLVEKINAIGSDGSLKGE